MKNSIAICVVFIFVSCSSVYTAKQFDREKEIKAYIADKNISFPVSSNGVVFMINNKNCNSCIMDLLTEVLDKFTKNPVPKLFVLTKWDTALNNQISLLSNVQAIVTDSLNDLQRYGLDYGDDLILKFEKGNIVDWTEISNQHFQKITEIATK